MFLGIARQCAIKEGRDERAHDIGASGREAAAFIRVREGRRLQPARGDEGDRTRSANEQKAAAGKVHEAALSWRARSRDQSRGAEAVEP